MISLESSITFEDFKPERPCSHRAVDPPICQECQELDLSFFDPTCVSCQEILKNPHTTIAEIFAILRQWVPQTQQNIDLLVEEMVARGANINDRDGLTDMSLLHYAAKAGANGVGDVKVASKVVTYLLAEGADATAKCRWTDMTPLHLAVFFDIEPVVRQLLDATNSAEIDRVCKEFDGGSALHIGCSNLALNSVKTLLKYGASAHFMDRSGKLPLQCIPKSESLPETSEDFLLAEALKRELQNYMSKTEPEKKRQTLSLSTLQALGLEMHDEVVVAGKVGTLRYSGTTTFASGQWAGVELHDAIGKNDGSVAGVRYFSCSPKHGVFAPITRVQKKNNSSDLSTSTLSNCSADSTNSQGSTDKTIQVGDRALAEEKIGTVRYVGVTEFACGTSQCIGEVSNETLSSEDSITTISPEKRSSLKKGKRYNMTNPELAKPKTPPKLDRTLGAQLNFTLALGMSVFANNEVGVVRYIGKVDFAPDVWLGIELRKPNGKNDGSVEGKKYFTCKPNHGLMVKPTKATCRGINCSQLIDLNVR